MALGPPLFIALQVCKDLNFASRRKKKRKKRRKRAKKIINGNVFQDLFCKGPGVSDEALGFPSSPRSFDWDFKKGRKKKEKRILI